jgi:hypothetical protein
MGWRESKELGNEGGKALEICVREKEVKKNFSVQYDKRKRVRERESKEDLVKVVSGRRSEIIYF